MRGTRVHVANRTSNRERILRLVLHDGALARVDLAQRSGLTPAAISNITRELITGGMLQEVGTQRTERVGANAILLDLPRHAPVIGVVHQGVSALRIGLSNLRGELVARREIATPTPYAPDWAAAVIAQTLRRLLVENAYDERDMLAVGAGLVGLIDAERGIVKRAPSFGWERVPLCALLKEHLTCSVAADNNVRAMAAGEALFGEGRSWSDFAFVYVGTGIGAGLVIAGSPYRGAHGGAGEIGHITVDPEGELCSCGNRGCLETVAAEPAILRRAAALGIELGMPSQANAKAAIRTLASRARGGDELAIQVIQASGESLGIALADLADLFNPERIVVHGAITSAGDLFVEVVSRALRQRAFLATNDAVTLVTPTYGEDAGLVGAAAIALDRVIFPLTDELRVGQDRHIAARR